MKMAVPQSHPKRRMGDLVVAVCGTLESYADLRLGQSRRVDFRFGVLFSANLSSVQQWHSCSFFLPV